MKSVLKIAALTLFTCCACSKIPESERADLVVYGPVYTADNLMPAAEGFAVRDGRFVCVGSRSSVGRFVSGSRTRVIDLAGGGMIIPGCAESHAHYLMDRSLTLANAVKISEFEDTKASIKTKLEREYMRAKHYGRKFVYAIGWNYQLLLMEDLFTRLELDEICPDLPLYMNDSEGHKGLANTKCLVNAGVTDAEGNLIMGQIRGGEICTGADNKATGLLKEQAGTYVRQHGIPFNEVLTDEGAKKVIQSSCAMLHKNGYTMYMDAWSNYFGGEELMAAAQALDREGGLRMNLGLSYEIESSNTQLNQELTKAFACSRYASTHVFPNFIKLFIDGTVEGGTGLTSKPYPDGHEGIQNWEQSEVADISKAASDAGFSMHIHTMGDKAVDIAVKAYESLGPDCKPMRNSLAHVRNMIDEDKQICADNDIIVISGMLWHVVMLEGIRYIIPEIVPEGMGDKSYPKKSLVEKGVTVTSHSDFPANSGSPIDPMGIMEIAVTGSMRDVILDIPSTPWWPQELLTRMQVLRSLTINGAYQLHIENERGSISPGKWADFVVFDNDAFVCDSSDIHKIKVLSTFFEGEQVYAAE